MQTRILSVVALALAAMVFHKVATMPQQPIPAEDAAFMAVVVEADTMGLSQSRSAELQSEIAAYNAKRQKPGDALIWTPPEF